MSARHTHLGVYAAIRRDGRFLLIKKTRGPYTGMFDLPGGKVEFGETPEAALRREVMEETGQTLTGFSLCFCDSVCFKHRATIDRSVECLHHIGIVYEARIDDGAALKNAADQDSGGAFWFLPTLDAMESLTPFAKEAVLRLLS